MKESSAEKLKLLFTVVAKGKAGIFVDLLEENGINAHFIIKGEGMKGKEMKEFLADTKKEVILSIVGEDKVKQVTRKLEDKFDKVKNSYGICWSVALSSVIGASTYRFLVDYRK